MTILFAAARRERRCARPQTKTDIRAIQRRVKHGTVIRAYRGLYAETAYWNTLDVHEQVRHIVRALAMQHPDWVFCGPTAAIMHGLDCSYRLAFPICVAARPGGGHRDTADLAHCVVAYPETTTIGHVKVTGLLRTLFDCAAGYPLRYSLGPLDSALRLGLVSKTTLLAYPCSVKYTRHRQAVERAFSLADGRSENGGESEARGVACDCGYPPDDVQPQFPCLDEPGRTHRGDFLWKRKDGTLVVGEFDGTRKYVDPQMTSGRTIREVVDEERRRQQCLERRRAVVLRMYHTDLDNPERVVRQLDALGVSRRHTSPSPTRHTAYSIARRRRPYARSR
ncbi:CTP synthase [Bifidobacterium leontopitheci]|uniref:CTP synthase n=1 Tax=Bifidobacterium leontopitheci TaxID=2650774 RepID=UPI001D01FE81|nr:CTP synthase [Bifidobacterium leontopitheci]